MDPVTRAAALVRVLAGRAPTEEEEAQFTGFGFDTFLIRLLCSDEAAERYGDISQHLIDHLRAETARDTLPHKLAHDLVLAKEEVATLQSRLDRLNGQMIDLLRQEDRIAGLFDAIRGIQTDFNTVRARLAQVETDMLQRAGAEDDDY
jgi:hypothetical protein